MATTCDETGSKCQITTYTEYMIQTLHPLTIIHECFFTPLTHFNHENELFVQLQYSVQIN